MKNQELNPDNEHLENETVHNDTDNSAENAIKGDVSADSKFEEENNEKVKELNEKYLRLYSEFDNYRKRTIKEKAEIIKTASEDVFKAIIPTIDDFERAIKANESAEDLNAVKEGIHLIYNKLKNTIQQKGLVAFESIGENFNPDTMEAITYVPALDDKQKGIVIDEAEKGYKLGEKVVRYAKVIIAQ